MFIADLADEGAGRWVLSVEGGPGELFDKFGCNISSVRQAFAGEGEWLIGGDERIFSLRGVEAVSRASWDGI